uniref:Uncharacterized protein n=1 Tax=Pseudomonas phage HRDY3 TaxID=3236930 RepID=A0AB39CE75_9VIRU
MLKSSMENPDINGNVYTRQRILSNASNFKPDRRRTAKDFTFQHHHVIELHGARYLVCVKDPETGAVLLLEAGAELENEYAISDCHALKFSAMRTEAKLQLSQHIQAVTARAIQRSLKASGRKILKEQNNG